MISMHQINNFYPAAISGNAIFQKYILKEYVQLLVLDYLSTTHYARKITFIGGTSLRLIKGIGRFSEDLDFDCKHLTEDEFISMSDDVLQFLRRNGFRVESRNRDKAKLTAFRTSIHFPELLFNLDLSGHRNERFMLKLEVQDQGIPYEPTMGFIKGCGFFFSFPVPSDTVLCAMKISAMLDRGKGRDFYDVMFLLSQTKPDYSFLTVRCGIGDLPALKSAVDKTLQTVDLHHKQKDFEHLLLQRENSKRILYFGEFIHSLTG
ncbi:MAG: nucleotidyl transferase AbiEii/AbiGii toxin family protein [Thermodesulfobacteriota bacterium]